MFASKLQAMVVDLCELVSTSRLLVLEAPRCIASARDVVKTTKQTFQAYQALPQPLSLLHI